VLLVVAVVAVAGLRFMTLRAQAERVGPCQNPYIVQPGDWITKIAGECGVNAADLIAGNALADPNQIQPGQQLFLPLPLSGDLTPPATSGAENAAASVASLETAPDSAPVAAAPSVPSDTILVVGPVADSFVDAQHPGEAYGRWTIVRTEGPVQTSYLTFDVSVPQGATVTGARLRVFAHGSSPAGFSLHAVDSADWDENGLTHASAPSVGAQLGASGAHGGWRYVEVNFGGFFAGTGRYSLALVPQGDKPVAFSSREAGLLTPELVLFLSNGAPVTPAPLPSVAPPQPSPTPLPPPTETPVQPTLVPPTVAPPTATPVPPTHTPLPSSPSPLPPAGNPLDCLVTNIAWSAEGQLLRGGRPDAVAVACLAAAGVDVLVDQRAPQEVDYDEAGVAALLGVEYINLGIPDDTAPSPSTLRAWIDTVNSRLAKGKTVLVHDRAGRGRMGFWDAVFAMLRGASAQEAIDDRYVGRALPFAGAKIGCGDGGNGQVQALAEIGQILTGSTYLPATDEYGTAWANCARPSYMDGWDYATVLP
jgi:LysM repeat protein